jgi:hypothetical protein
MAAKKRFADIKHPLIQAILGGHYQFADMQQAQTQLGVIKSHYFISRHPEHKDAPDCCTLWVRGYDVTDTEKK